MGSTETLDRLAREQAFHDERFASAEPEERDRFYAFVGGARRRLAEATDQFVAGDRVLEIGVGLSSTGWSLARRGVRVLAIDISPVAVDRARLAASAEGLDNMTFAVMNAESLVLDDDSFDGVVGSGILHHLDISIAYSEVRRVLRPGGRAVFYEPLGHNPLINGYRDRTPGMRTDDEHPLLKSDIATAREHFDGVDATMHHLAVIVCAFLPARLRRLARPVLDAADALITRLPGLRWWSWITVIELSEPVGPAPGR